MSSLIPIDTTLSSSLPTTDTVVSGGGNISDSSMISPITTTNQQTSLLPVLPQEKDCNGNMIMTDRNLYNQQQVESFLSQCGLTQYYDTFIEEGFDRVESLLEITETDLIHMQVKRGHRRLLQRAIANAKGMPNNVPLNITPIVNNNSNNNNNNNKQPQQSVVTTNNDTTNTNNNNNNMAGYNKTTKMQPNEAMDVSLQLLAQQAANSPLLTSSSTNGTSSTSSSTSSSLSIPPPLPPPTTNILTAQPNDYFPSAGTMTHSATSGMSSTEEEAVTSDNVHRLWKRKYHRHAKPDTNAPLKPPSAYVMFSNDVRAELKQENKSFTDLAKIIGDRWKNITPGEKELYETNALRSREDYLKKLEEYHKTDSFKKYQQYISDFKAENEAAARPVGRPRKRHRRDQDNKYNSDGTISDSSTMPPASKAPSSAVTTTMMMSSTPNSSSRRASSTQPTDDTQHKRTCSISSDPRHYPFYLLNNEELSNTTTTSPTTLNGPGGGEGPPPSAS